MYVDKRLLKKILLISHVVLVFYVLFLVLCVILYLFSRSLSNTPETIVPLKAYRYQSLSFNPTNDEYSFDLVSTLDQLGSEQSITTFNDDGSIELISRYGETEYHCTGTSALSTLVAAQKAKNYFHEECVNELSGQCVLNEIHSEVDECEDVNAKTNEDSSSGNDGEDGEIRFFCSGVCSLEPLLYERYISNVKAWDNSQRVMDLALNQDLSMFYPEVPFPIQMLNTWNEMCPTIELEKEVSVKSSEADPKKRAETIFVEQTLRGFCWRESEFGEIGLPPIQFLEDHYPEYDKERLCGAGEATCRKIT